MKKKNGFTLIELVIVILLLGIIAVVSSKMLTTGLTAYLTGKNVLDANAQARLGMERMIRDIRSVRSPADITAATSTQFTFTDVNSISTSYVFGTSTITRNGQVLVDGISLLTLAYADKNGTTTGTLANIRYITINLNINQGNTSFSIKSTVYPRNLP